MKIEVSNGEIVDKMSILQIKSERIDSVEKVRNVLFEIESIEKEFFKISSYTDKDYLHLKEVNEKLWDIEDKIREKERQKFFDQSFIDLARSVYITNDVRADIKKKINKETNSSLSEEKSYSGY